MYSFSYLEPVCCSMCSSNCCFLTCIQISQEADQVVWYSNLFQNFPQCIVIHTVKGFGIVNKAEIDVFLELSCFFYDPVMSTPLLINKCKLNPPCAPSLLPESLSFVQLFANPWTVVCQTPLFIKQCENLRTAYSSSSCLLYGAQQ